MTKKYVIITDFVSWDVTTRSTRLIMHLQSFMFSPISQSLLVHVVGFTNTMFYTVRGLDKGGFLQSVSFFVANFNFIQL